MQHGGGGYPIGFRYPADSAGRREFRVKLTPELRTMLRLPPHQLYYGHYVNKKPIEAASKAYTAICRYLGGECPELHLTLVDLSAQTRLGPKENSYWIARRPNEARGAGVRFSSGRAATYRWRYDILPEKRHLREDAARLRAARSSAARQRYSQLAVKPRRSRRSSAI